VIHDWNYLLHSMNLLTHDTLIAGATRGLGLLCMLCGVLWGAMDPPPDDILAPSGDRHRLGDAGFGILMSLSFGVKVASRFWTHWMDATHGVTFPWNDSSVASPWICAWDGTCAHSWRMAFNPL